MKSKKKKHRLGPEAPVERPLVPLLDGQEVCGILHVNKRTLQRMNWDGRLKPFALLSPNAPRYHPDDVRRLLEQSAPSAEKAPVPRQFLAPSVQRARAERYAAKVAEKAALKAASEARRKG